jgi:hypothetical protein
MEDFNEAMIIHDGDTEARRIKIENYRNSGSVTVRGPEGKSP